MGSGSRAVPELEVSFAPGTNVTECPDWLLAGAKHFVSTKGMTEQNKEVSHSLFLDFSKKRTVFWRPGEGDRGEAWVLQHRC